MQVKEDMVGGFRDTDCYICARDYISLLSFYLARDIDCYICAREHMIVTYVRDSKFVKFDSDMCGL